MKKYIVFAISFMFLFAAFQILSGYFLTLFFTPDISSAWNQAGSLPSNTVIKGGSFFTPLLFAFLVATLAYFTPKLFVKDNSQ